MLTAIFIIAGVAALWFGLRRVMRAAAPPHLRRLQAAVSYEIYKHGGRFTPAVLPIPLQNAIRKWMIPIDETQLILPARWELQLGEHEYEVCSPCVELIEHHLTTIVERTATEVSATLTGQPAVTLSNAGPSGVITARPVADSRAATVVELCSEKTRLLPRHRRPPRFGA
jgi:hypothetical protein